ncbi:MAG: c-type cytochrome, partial [Chitinophagaceae bacterium]
MTETINFSRMKKIFVLITGLVVFCSATVPVYSPIKNNSADPLKESIARGEEVYTNFCKSCHQETGAGLESSFPPLAKADYLKKFPKESIYAVKFGMEGKIVVNGVTYE